MSTRCRRATTLVFAVAIFAAASRSALVQGVSASLATDSSMPVLKQPTLPAYPPGNTAAAVDIEVVVDVSGAIVHTRVATSSDPALSTVPAWRQ